MANNRQIKNRIVTANNISKITKAMEMVAASKMKKAQDQAISARAYARALSASLKTVSQATNSSLHPLLSINQEGVPIILVISTDKGLCGSLNAHLLKGLLEWKKSHRVSPEVIAVGKKAVLFARSAGFKIYAQFTELPEKITLADILPIGSLVMKGFLEKSFSSVDVIYMDFINTLSQQTKMERLLPLTSFEQDKNTQPKGMYKEYLFEPSAKAILNQLLPYYIENTIYQLFLESKASEHSARMVAMKNASENARDLVSELKLIYNKTRQQAITSELLDIATATLVL